MMKTIQKSQSLLGVLMIAAFFSGCTQRVLVPPRVELRPYGRIGIFQFSCSAQGDLGRFATQRFIESVQSSQPGTPMIELGPLHNTPDPQFLREINRKSGADVVFLGNVDISQVRPDVDFSSLMTALKVRADVEATILVKLYETQQGATLWTRSAFGHENVAQVGISKDGKAYFEGSDLEKAYGALVHRLIEAVTDDLRPHYIGRK